LQLEEKKWRETSPRCPAIGQKMSGALFYWMKIRWRETIPIDGGSGGWREAGRGRPLVQELGQGAWQVPAMIEKYT
jgi:hypothetical protein